MIGDNKFSAILLQLSLNWSLNCRDFNWFIIDVIKTFLMNFYPIWNWTTFFIFLSINGNIFSIFPDGRTFKIENWFIWQDMDFIIIELYSSSLTHRTEILFKCVPSLFLIKTSDGAEPILGTSDWQELDPPWLSCRPCQSVSYLAGCCLLRSPLIGSEGWWWWGLLELSS